MTLKDLIRRFRTDANDKVEPYFCEDEEVIEWLNDAVDEAMLRGRLVHESSDQSVCRIAVKQDKTTYALHAKLFEITHLTFVKSGETKRHPVSLISTEHLDDIMPDWRSRSDVPRYAVQDDTSLRLVPSPDADGALQLEGYRLSTAPMEGGDDEPEINEAHHRHLVHWALHRAYSIPDSEFVDASRAEKAEAEFTRYFGARPDADMRRATRDDVPHHVNPFWV